MMTRTFATGLVAFLLAGAWSVCLTPAAHALILHLKFDETSGATTAADSSGNGHHGTLLNADANAAWVPGVAGNAVQLTTSNDFVRVDDHANLKFGAGDFTVSFWVNKRADSSGCCTNLWGVNKWNTGSSPNSNEWSFALTTGNNDNIPRFNMRGVDENNYALSATTNMSLNTWYHLAAMREGGELRIYVNGVLEAINSALGTVAMNAVTNRHLFLGNSATNCCYPDAAFDDLQIYGRALSDGGITIGETAGGELGFMFNNPGMTAFDMPPPPIIPEPSTLLLLAVGSAVSLQFRRRRR